MRDASLRQRSFDKFRDILLTEVVPQVEKRYPVLKDRDSRAIAGLSMGGAESLHIGLNNLNRFAWIGAFSSGGIADDFKAAFPLLKSSDATQIRSLWISCGTEDRLIETSRKLREWLKSTGIRPAEIETPGGHTWMVWRRNLTSFVPLLFQPKTGQAQH